MVRDMIYLNEPKCRSRGSIKSETVLSLAQTPLSDHLLRSDPPGEPELLAPLPFVLGNESTLAKIRETAKLELLIHEEYPYFSSVSPSLMDHFRKSAYDIMASRYLNGNSLVGEAASNDGYMLKNIAQERFFVLGIDAAQPPAQFRAVRQQPALGSTLIVRKV